MTFLQDLRYAQRTLFRSKGFLLLAVLTLGLGISASTAVFSLFYQVLLKSLPVPDAQNLVVLDAGDFSMPGRRSADNSATTFSYPLYRHLRDNVHGLKGIAARSGMSLLMQLENGTERLDAEAVSGNFFDVLEVQPAGRLLHASDDTRGSSPAAVLSYAAWKARFGGLPSVVGRPVNLNGHPFVIAGVAPEGFRGVLAGSAPEVFVPIQMRPLLDEEWKEFDRADNEWLALIGRLNPAIPAARATAELQTQFTNEVRRELDVLKVKNARSRRRLSSAPIRLSPAATGLNELGRQWGKPLAVLAAMVGMLLLIGCANLANLLLARGASRWRETAIRLAVGAKLSRIFSMILAESLIVAAAGAVAGVLLTPLLTQGVLALLPSDAVVGWVVPDVSWPVVAFSVLLIVACGVLSGLAPAWQASRTGASLVLGDRSTSAGGHLSPRLRQVLVAGQVALSLVLLSTGALFARSFAKLADYRPGFRSDHLLTFAVDAAPGGYSRERGEALYQQIWKKLAGLPGAESAAYAILSPLSNSDSSSNVSIEGYHPQEGEDMDANVNGVSPAFFRTLGTPLVAGREFTVSDHAKAPKVAVVNEAFRKRFFGDKNPVGRHMARGGGGAIDVEIVGVSQDMPLLNLKDKVRPAFFLPFEQVELKSTQLNRSTFFVRTSAAENSIGASAREIVARMDRGLPVFSMETMELKVKNNVATERMLAALTGAFGLIALVLTAVGLYGVIAYVVTQRTPEIGIRMALGADSGNILRMVLHEVLMLVGAGATVGVVGALAANRAIRAQLFAMGGWNLSLLILALAVLTAVALGAGLLPAWRASRIHPLEALRHE